jgi:two-component system, NarL family, response regulator NreC
VNQATTRVLVSDAHPLFRQGIQSLLSSTQDMSVVGEATDGNETLIKVETCQPDVVLLDVDIPGIRSFDVACSVRRASPSVKVLLLTPSEESGRVQSTIPDCAYGYVVKSASPNSIVAAIRNARNSSLNLTPNGFERLFHDLQALSSNLCERRPDPNALTPRELVVLNMIVQGRTAKHIAQHFRLSIKTVEAHRFNLMRKLDVHSRGELVELVARKQFNGFSRTAAESVEDERVS